MECHCLGPEHGHPFCRQLPVAMVAMVEAVVAMVIVPVVVVWPVAVGRNQCQRHCHWVDIVEKLYYHAYLFQYTHKYV